MSSLFNHLYKHPFRENNWMDEKTKEKALEKAEAMSEIIGYQKGRVYNFDIFKYIILGRSL